MKISINRNIHIWDISISFKDFRKWTFSIFFEFFTEMSSKNNKSECVPSTRHLASVEPIWFYLVTFRCHTFSGSVRGKVWTNVWHTDSDPFIWQLRSSFLHKLLSFDFSFFLLRWQSLRKTTFIHMSFQMFVEQRSPYRAYINFWDLRHRRTLIPKCDQSVDDDTMSLFPH